MIPRHVTRFPPIGTLPAQARHGITAGNITLQLPHSSASMDIDPYQPPTAQQKDEKNSKASQFM
jgi:hypothetical protein